MSQGNCSPMTRLVRVVHDGKSLLIVADLRFEEPLTQEQRRDLSNHVELAIEAWLMGLEP